MAITGIEPGISDALIWHASTLATSLPWEWPGINYQPSDANRLRAQLFRVPAEKQALAIDRYEGTLQVDVIWRTGAGVIAAEEEAAAVCAHFLNAKIERNGRVVQVIRPPFAASPIADADWLIIPCNIRWTSWVHN